MPLASVSNVSASARATLRSHAEARYARWVWGGMRQSRLPPTQGERRERSRPGIPAALGAACPPGRAFPPPRGVALGKDRSAWEIDYKSSISETRKVSHMHIVIYMSLLLRLNFSHYELPITYIKEFLTEILIYRS